MNIEKALLVLGQHKYGNFEIKSVEERSAILALYDFAKEAKDKIARRNIQIADLKQQLNSEVLKYALRNAEANIASRDELDTTDKKALALIKKLTA